MESDAFWSPLTEVTSTPPTKDASNPSQHTSTLGLSPPSGSIPARTTNSRHAAAANSAPLARLLSTALKLRGSSNSRNSCSMPSTTTFNPGGHYERLRIVHNLKVDKPAIKAMGLVSKKFWPCGDRNDALVSPSCWISMSNGLQSCARMHRRWGWVMFQSLPTQHVKRFLQPV